MGAWVRARQEDEYVYHKAYSEESKIEVERLPNSTKSKRDEQKLERAKHKINVLEREEELIHSYNPQTAKSTSSKACLRPHVILS